MYAKDLVRTIPATAAQRGGFYHLKHAPHRRASGLLHVDLGGQDGLVDVLDLSLLSKESPRSPIRQGARQVAP